MTHPFEEDGLGRAPYDFVGLEKFEPKVRCDYCNKAINYKYFCKSADGKRFGVGSECIKRAAPSLFPKVEKARKEFDDAYNLERVKRAKKILKNRPRLLSNRPHPFGIPNKSLRDYIEFVFELGSLRKQASVCHYVEDAGTKPRRNGKRSKK